MVYCKNANFTLHEGLENKVLLYRFKSYDKGMFVLLTYHSNTLAIMEEMSMHCFEDATVSQEGFTLI